MYLLKSTITNKISIASGWNKLYFTNVFPQAVNSYLQIFDFDLHDFFCNSTWVHFKQFLQVGFLVSILLKISSKHKHYR